MFESDYTKADRAYNAFERLTNQLAELRQALCECSQLIARNAGSEDWPYVAYQVKTLIGNVEGMAQDASKRWIEIEAHVAESAAKLAVERPSEHMTWGTMILDKAWRSWNTLNRQILANTDDKTLVNRFAKCAETLEAFDDPKELNLRTKREFLAGAAFAQLHHGFQLQSSEANRPNAEIENQQGEDKNTDGLTMPLPMKNVRTLIGCGQTKFREMVKNRELGLTKIKGTQTVRLLICEHEKLVANKKLKENIANPR